ncbi:MAG TPA: hypothetical protein VI643_04355 [Planctomycetota bacterium]|nr:hypothetical protein [Planctomycetota bacterium]
MRAITPAWISLAALFAGCGGGGEPQSAAAKPSVAQEHERPNLDLLEGDILKQRPNYSVTDPETGVRFDVRLYVEHNTGADYEVAVVTTPHGKGHRLANYREYTKALAQVQADRSARGDAIEQTLNTYYSVDSIRARTAVPERIKFQERVIADLEHELDRLARQIKAHEEVPGNESPGLISFWIKEMYARKELLIREKTELQKLLYRKMLLQQQADELSRPARQ